ncbi:OmpA family protein [Pseudomonas sp. BIGb0164]|uniref:OmpA family protein n=1 Tax=Pseudomonas sp. BIGb0164 TaxID=2940605 RepID=UPI00216A8372|nr:OmpA family protein [Pseudomonas sp. BIGb0164]MCS4250140.1 OOP family OmpA-OmpF porin [Pseudomonas sp. BIGb0164]
MFTRNNTLTAALFAAAVCAMPLAHAEQQYTYRSADIQSFGNGYQPVAPVSDGQAQVIYYRGTDGQQRGSANVYVDREFHTSLLPGGYTAFCVEPGSRTLGAYIGDAPSYRGKTTDLYSAKLEGGKTYFLKVRENGNGAPLAVTRADAERELAGSRAQVQALSRASKVQQCNFVDKPAEAFKDYALSGDVLFAFGKSGYQDISSRGRVAILELVTQLNREHAKLDRVVVVGHTDPIGSYQANQTLGLKRAQTVRRLLIDGGIPSTAVIARSAGSSEPVTDECYGSKAEQVACNAPNRRVVVRVDVSGQ